MATAQFGRMAVDFVNDQYEDGASGEGVVFALAPVRVSEEQLWAALWHIAAQGTEPEELEDGEYVRGLVTEVIVNAGWGAVNVALHDLRSLTARDGKHYEWAQEMRGYVRAAFTDALPAPRPRACRAARRELAGVK